MNISLFYVNDLDAGLPDGGELVVEHMHELSLTHTIPAHPGETAHNNPFSFKTKGGQHFSLISDDINSFPPTGQLRYYYSLS